MIIPPQLVVLGLKFAAARVVYKGVEHGVGKVSRSRAIRTAPEGASPDEIAARAEAAEMRGRQAFHVARHLRHLRHL